jgi:hypothetical protein
MKTEALRTIETLATTYMVTRHHVITQRTITEIATAVNP